MRTFFTLKQQIIPFLAELLPILTDKLTIVARNPSQPEFNHFLFETISFCVKYVLFFFLITVHYIINDNFFFSSYK